jgi:hypothetical protein
MPIKHFLVVSTFSLIALTGCGSDNDKKNNSSSMSSSSQSSSVVSSSSSSSSSSDVSSSESSESSSESSEASSSESSVTSSESSSSSSSVSSMATLQLTGTAAIGAPIVGGAVSAKCADGSGFTNPVATNAQGVFTGLIASGALPCALQVSGGTPAVVLHSYAATSGTVNITPLTDLILANASNQSPANWFANPDWNNIANIITTAQAEIKSALENAGYTLPAGDFTPFSVAFAIGDTWDQLLDQIQLAIDESVAIENYLALVDLIRGGNLASFPTQPSSSSSSSSLNQAVRPVALRVARQVVLQVALRRAAEQGMQAVVSIPLWLK